MTIKYTPRTLVELLQYRAMKQADEMVYTFIEGKPGGGILAKESITYAQLDNRAAALAKLLQSSAKKGERALLLYPSGIEYMVAFFACLYAGIIAVPVYPPRSSRPDPRINAITADCQATIILTPQRIAEKNLSPELNALIHLNESTTIDNDPFLMPDIDAQTLAFLQYTSGSTGQPKGVMVSHANLICNLEDQDLGLKHTRHSIMVSWLPLFHDMGLIYGALQSIYKGFPCYLMSPASFLQKPFRWLEAISKYRATHTAAPNFAYDLCVEQISPEQRQDLELSSLQVALNGAEPLRDKSIKRFIATFAPQGLAEKAICPCYGLAEATLKVSCNRYDEKPFYIRVEPSALANNHCLIAEPDADNATILTGCGFTEINTTIKIVNTTDYRLCEDTRIGEIWVSGNTVTQGYWQRKEESKTTFQAYTHDQQGPFMRTGDLGFIYQKHLFISGRLKDMIIIRGLNIYPQDIEIAVSQCHFALKNNACAAFSIEKEQQEQLIVVQEVERTALRQLDTDKIITSIQQAVAETHDLNCYAIILIRPMSMPKTTSGKVQRSTCKHRYLNNNLTTVAKWQQVTVKNIPLQKSTDLVTELTHIIAQILAIEPHKIEKQKPLASYGMDSLKAIRLASALETWSTLTVSPIIIYDYPNLDALIKYFCQQLPEQNKAKSPPKKISDNDDIAIIGMACRFPGAQNLQAFSELLKNGIDAIQKVPDTRWLSTSKQVAQLTKAQQQAISHGGFIDAVEQFDPLFFGITPREAHLMDPQQRILLEVVWEALQHAGILPESIAERQTGVFVGISTDDYKRLQQNQNMPMEAHLGTGNAFSIAANRLSYIFHCLGPSMAIDTACSSSLVALHQATQSLRLIESDMAIVAGINLMLTPELSCIFSQAGMLSLESRCKSFADNADGYVRSEGCGVVLLKRYNDALVAGDNIVAKIKGSAINQDGQTNGLTAPNGLAQQAVIKQALRNAAIKPAALGYVETHGTGTILGDPIEINALSKVLIEGRNTASTCYFGTVKSNIGHLEAAAGMAGLLKTIISLQQKTIFPNLHFKQINPLIDIANSPFKIPVKCNPWPPNEQSELALAGVSSFGFGGTNAHVILEEVIQHTPQPEAQRSHHLFTLSAKTPENLPHLQRTYLQYLQTNPQLKLAQLCYTVNNKRSHYTHRLAYAVQDIAELTEKLKQSTENTENTGTDSNVAFLFAGQGSQYAGMAKLLFTTQAVFRNALLHCESLLKDHLDKPLMAIIFADEATLKQTLYTQPALFSVQYALAQLWLTWGVKPSAVMGHSLGEYVAACIAGVFCLEDALLLVSKRAQLMQSLALPGKMLVVFCPSEKLRLWLKKEQDKVSIAAYNSAKNCVISGATEVIERLQKHCTENKIRQKLLTVSHAFHSPLMQVVVQQFNDVAKKITYHPPQLPLYSNLTGLRIDKEIATSQYWCQHIIKPVQFSKSIENLYSEQNIHCFLEISAKPVLLGMAKENITSDATYIASLRPGFSDWQQILQALGKLYQHGVNINWDALNKDYVKQAIDIPITPFVRQSYWFDQDLKTRVNGQSTHKNMRYWLAQDSAVQAKKRLHQYLLNVLSEEISLAANKIDKNMGFADMGMDSILLVNLGNRLNKNLQINLSATTLINYANFKSLFSHLYYDVLKLDKQTIRQTKTPKTKHLPFSDEIAIIGMGCRFPGADNPDLYWQFLQQGLDICRTVPEERWQQSDYYHAERSPGKMQMRQGYFLEDIDQFDADFFAISPREAQSLDPQQRLLLEVSWQALEHAGLLKEKLAQQKVGSFIGIGQHDYMQRQLNSNQLTGIDAYWGTGNGSCFASGRLAYFLGLQGPSLALDTACSSSLVALHLACQSLLSGEIDAALTGGVQLILSPEISIFLSQIQALSSDGRCKSFSAAADGFGRGEGCGMLVLKRVADAKADNDRILAIIKGSAVNHDGNSSGLTVPSGLAQQAVIQEALHKANLDSIAIDYLEAHGTGTELGDPLEIEALQQVFTSHDEKHPLLVGTVKANIGHLEAAAGVAGIIKTVLAMQHKSLPKQLHYEQPNPHIDWHQSAIKIVDSQYDGAINYAGVSSFGLSGTNAHVILSSYTAPLSEVEKTTTKPFLLALSAHALAALQQQVDNLLALLQQHPTLSWQDVCFTNNQLRTHHLTYRMTVIATTSNEALTQLRAFQPQVKKISYSPIEPAMIDYNDLDNVAYHYLKGETIDWSTMTSGKRIDLPYYPFQKSSYWVKAKPHPETQTHPKIDIKQALATTCYRLKWQQQKLDISRSTPASGLLIFCHVEQAKSLSLRKYFPEATVVNTHQKEHFYHDLENQRYFVNPEVPAQLSALFSALQQQNIFLQTVLYAWPLGAQTVEHLNCESLAKAQDLGCYGLYHLLMAIQSQTHYTLNIWVITQTAIAMHNDQALPGLAQTPLWGMAKTWVLEWPETFAGLINIAGATDGKHILAEITHPQEDFIHYHNDARYIARVVADSPDLRQRPPINYPQGHYLITGGLGALGLQVADWLANKGAAHLYLLSRRPPNEAAQQQIDKLIKCYPKLQLKIINADVSNRPQMQTFFAQYPLNGIIHAAGTVAYEPLQKTSLNTWKNAFQAKVIGGWLLHQLSLAQPLDFFVTFSSVAAVIGAKGQAHYAAANAFLDALVSHRIANNLPALTINWGPWSDGGMVTADIRTLLQQHGVNALSAKFSLQALNYCLNHHYSHVIIADIDWPVFKLFFSLKKRGKLLSLIDADVVQTGSSDNNSPSELENIPADEREDKLLAQLKLQVAEVLNSDSERIDVERGLFEIGLDSLMAVEITKRISHYLNHQFEATLLFDYPNLQALNQYLLVQMGWQQTTETLTENDKINTKDEPNENDESIADKLKKLESLVGL